MNLKTRGPLAAMLITIVMSSACGLFGIGKTANPVEQLMALCKDDNFKEAAKHMRYPGMDKAKKDQTANYDSDDPNEKRQIEGECRRFKSGAAIPHTISPERTEQGLSVFDVQFNDGAKNKKEIWAFKKAGSDYVLVDID